jgi:DNA-binding response OmpR family regulator
MDSQVDERIGVVPEESGRGTILSSSPEYVPMAADLLKFGDGLELDRGAYELRRSGRSLKLERIPMEILLLMLDRRGQLISREDIIEGCGARTSTLTPTTASTPPSERFARP